MRQLASIVRVLRNHHVSSNDTPICTYVNSSNDLVTFSQSQVLSHLRSIAAAISPDKLGFAPNGIETKSIISSTGMAWYLAGVPHPSIQLMGRWKSEAWLCCIRKQVLEFRKGMSKALLQNEFLHTLPPLNEGLSSTRARPGHSYH